MCNQQQQQHWFIDPSGLPIHYSSDPNLHGQVILQQPQPDIHERIGPEQAQHNLQAGYWPSEFDQNCLIPDSRWSQPAQDAVQFGPVTGQLLQTPTADDYVPRTFTHDQPYLVEAPLQHQGQFMQQYQDSHLQQHQGHFMPEQDGHYTVEQGSQYPHDWTSHYVPQHNPQEQGHQYMPEQEQYALCIQQQHAQGDHYVQDQEPASQAPEAQSSEDLLQLSDQSLQPSKASDCSDDSDCLDAPVRQPNRERNRSAALKCRTKKKSREDGLSESAFQGRHGNINLRTEVPTLRESLRGLQGFASGHLCVCDHKDPAVALQLQQYLLGLIDRLQKMDEDTKAMNANTSAIKARAAVETAARTIRHAEQMEAQIRQGGRRQPGPRSAATQADGRSGPRRRQSAPNQTTTPKVKRASTAGVAKRAASTRRASAPKRQTASRRVSAPQGAPTG